jgi:hypothetical protein
MTATAPSTMIASPASQAAQLIDVGIALDLLARVVDDCGEDFTSTPVAGPSHPRRGYVYALDGRPQCIVGHALARASVDVAQLEQMRDEHLRDLYRDGRLPVKLSLGALTALDAAQRSQDRGLTWGAALEDATAAAARYFDLVSAVPQVMLHLDRCANRCPVLDSAAKE